MAISQEAFSADCISWNGYKPCAIQKEEGLPDCFGCTRYEPGPVVCTVENQAFDPEMLADVSEVGIVETGGLGSILRTTAVTRAIRELNPSVDITWFTHERGADLLRYVPGVTPVNVETTELESLHSKIRELDVLLNFELSPAAKEIVPFARYVGGFILNAQGKFSGVMPAAEYMQRLQIDDDFRKANHLTMQEILLESVGLGEAEAQYDVSLRPDNYAAAEEALHHAFSGHRPDTIVGLNVGTSEKGVLRRWPAERYAALAQQLATANPEIGIAILSGPEDAVTCQRVVDLLGERTSNLAVIPVLEVGDFIALMGKMRLVVTSDTFAMHAAKSQATPTVTLVGPMPHRELELTPADRLIGPMLSCSPCYHKCWRPVAGQCMRDITVDRVGADVEAMLATAGPRG